MIGKLAFATLLVSGARCSLLEARGTGSQVALEAEQFAPEVDLLENLEVISSPNRAAQSNATDTAAQVALPAQTEGYDWSEPSLCIKDYCVYHHPFFAGGQGVVVISHPDIANEISELQVFKELASNRQATLDFLRDEGINADARLVETREIAGKGRGLVAKQTLQRGQRIMAHTPALIVQRRFIDDLSTEEQEQLLRDGIECLPDPTKASFWKQAGKNYDDKSVSVLDIIMNNSFDMLLDLPLNHVKTSGETDQRSFFGNFPRVSMYNHDCRPSVAFYLDHAGLTHHTHTVQPISAGEELSISYINSFRVRSVRQDRIKRNWGFACSCAQCSFPEAIGNASDNRLSRIYDLEHGLQNFDDDAGLSSSESPGEDSMELLLSLYEQERLLASNSAKVYQLVALNYNAFGRAELATKYALLALEACLLEQGPSAVGTRAMLDLLQDGVKHWSWRKRVSGV